MVNRLLILLFGRRWLDVQAARRRRAASIVKDEDAYITECFRNVYGRRA